MARLAIRSVEESGASGGGNRSLASAMSMSNNGWVPVAAK